MNVEIRKLADEANRCYGRYKQRLVREGHKIRGDVDLRAITGISSAAEVLRSEWVEAETVFEAEAGEPSQRLLPAEEMHSSNRNPYGLFIDQDYELIQSPKAKKIPLGTRYTFRAYNSDTDIYTFHNVEHGGMKLKAVDVPLYIKVPGHAAAPTAAAVPEPEDDGYRKIIVGEDRFDEIAKADFSSKLVKRFPMMPADAIVSIEEERFIVTAVKPEKIWLTPVFIPEPEAERGESDFRIGKVRWSMRGPSARVIVIAGQLSDVLAQDEPVEPPIEVMEPLAFVLDMKTRGFFKEGDDVELAPESFDALFKAVHPDTPVGGVRNFRHERLVFKCANGGIEIPGYDGLKPKAKRPAPVPVFDTCDEFAAAFNEGRVPNEHGLTLSNVADGWLCTGKNEAGEELLATAATAKDSVVAYYSQHLKPEIQEAPATKKPRKGKKLEADGQVHEATLGQPSISITASPDASEETIEALAQLAEHAIEQLREGAPVGEGASPSTVSPEVPKAPEQPVAAQEQANANEPSLDVYAQIVARSADLSETIGVVLFDAALLNKEMAMVSNHDDVMLAGKPINVEWHYKGEWREGIDAWTFESDRFGEPGFVNVLQKVEARTAQTPIGVIAFNLAQAVCDQLMLATSGTFAAIASTLQLSDTDSLQVGSAESHTGATDNQDLEDGEIDLEALGADVADLVDPHATADQPIATGGPIDADT